MDDLKLDPQLPGNVWSFIYAYVNCRDKEKAAVRARFKPEAGRRLFRVPRIYHEICVRIKEQDLLTAQLIASSNQLTVEKLDSHLVKTLDDLEPGLP